jgi:hypothetical protein
MRVQCVCVFARVLICVFALICVCARVRACMRSLVSTCARVRAFQSDCVFARVCVASEIVRLAATCALPSHGGDFLMARPTPRVGGRARGCVRCHRPGPRASAAGVTWMRRTANAGWAARDMHKSVIDAAGAIYVIGGRTDTTYFNDVYASTDGGALLDSVRGVGGGVFEGVLRGTRWVLWGY